MNDLERERVYKNTSHQLLDSAIGVNCEATWITCCGRGGGTYSEAMRKIESHIEDCERAINMMKALIKQERQQNEIRGCKHFPQF